MGLGSPLLRLAIVGRPSSCQFVLTLHHSLYDEWSLEIIFDQVETAYRGEPVRPCSFNPFVAYLAQSKLPATEFWLAELVEISIVQFPALPSSDYIPSAISSLTYNMTAVPKETRDDFTAPIKFQLAWAVAISQYTASTDVVFGMTVNGRNAPVPGIEQITGPVSPHIFVPLESNVILLFARHRRQIMPSFEYGSECSKSITTLILNQCTKSSVTLKRQLFTVLTKLLSQTIATFPVRVQFETRQQNTIEDALQYMQDRFAAAMPFEQFGLQNIATLGDDAACATQFQSLLIIQPPKQTRDRYLFQQMNEDLDAEGFSTYALNLVCDPSSGQVKVTFDPQIICETQLRRILYQFEYLLKQIDQDRTRSLSDIFQIGPKDSLQLQTWNSKIPDRVDSCVHELISKNYVSQPEEQAVYAWDGSFTYRQLDNLSSMFATHLTTLRVSAENFVPIYMEKSKWVPVAMLGVMKAGGCFVLLDITLPIQRLQVICQTIKPALLVTSVRHMATAADLASTIVLAPDTECDWRHSGNDTFAPSPKASPGNALYGVFTSGSTGTPKCVVVDHAAFCTMAVSYSKAFGWTNETRIFQMSSHAFDASIGEILTSLIVGGCLCIPQDADLKDNIANSINNLNANWLELTPSVARIINQDDIPSVKTVVLGGEALAAEDVAQWTKVELYQA
jgi:hypothetical protein